MTRKVINILTTLLLILVAICALISFVGCGETEEKWDKVQTVEDNIYEKYFSMEERPRDSYKIKSYWKNNELQYVTVEHQQIAGVEVYTYVAIFDDDLELVTGLADTNRERLWEEIYQIAEGL